ncbi:hypothetical protein SAY87_022755 [Trapa incisa]|uniref:DUF4378 domain-containing protein n=1 Tax=Trapa incisa TaxID=236973 RepID=A0AAN7K4N7_9MYRT|nr:hypothetical protein SAY87_022755 [Trapa incisa]
MGKNFMRARLKSLISEGKSMRKAQGHRNLMPPGHLHSAPVYPSHQSKNSNDRILLNEKRAAGILPMRRASSAPPFDEVSTSDRLEDHWDPGLIKVNEEFLRKILHDKRNFVPPYPSNSLSEASIPSKIKNIDESMSVKDKESLEDAHDHEERDGDSYVAFTPVLLPPLKDRRENPEARRRFRDIREKIKHLIQTDQDKQRILMDGVLDKMPSDQRVSEEKKEEHIKKRKECVINKDYCSSPQSEEKYESRMRRCRRTSSLDNSMQKYCELFDAIFRTEAKQHMQEGLDVRKNEEEAGLQAEREKRSLGRILSLPNLKSYSCGSEYSSPSGISTDTPYLDSQNQLQLDARLECGQLEENHADTKSTVLENLETEKGSSPAAEEYYDGASISALGVNCQEISQDHGTVTTSEEDSELPLRSRESEARDLPLIKQQEDLSIDKSTEFEGGVNLEDPEIGGEPLHDFLQFQVNINDVELFNFVKAVLEVSGLGGNEAPEVWKSENQSVSYSVYEEVENYLLMDPECSGNELDGGDPDHLLLFDMTNEVLVDIYQQSLSYWPAPLARHCNIRQVPVGPHLLRAVWANITTYLGFRIVLDPSLTHVFRMDLEKGNRWMDLQFESECTCIELEELIFDDLLEELISLDTFHPLTATEAKQNKQLFSHQQSYRTWVEEFQGQSPNYGRGFPQ